MGGDTQTTTSTSAPSNPAVDATVTKILGGVNSQLDTSPKVFGESLYGGVGPTTQQGWTSALTAANNPDYTSGIKGAIKSYSDIAAGNFGNDPVRTNLINDVTTNANNSFNASGLFGSDSNQRAVGQGLGAALGQYDQSRQAQAAQLLPSLFQSSLLPSTVQGQIGGAQDANTQAALLGRNDLYRRTNDAQRDNLAWGSSVLTGPASASGTTQTQTQPATPWWQSALGLGIGAAGAFL